MLNIIYKLLIVFFTFTFLTGMGEKPDITQSISETSQVSLHVTGMTCSMCAQSIEKKLKENITVQDISVDFDNQIIIVTYQTADPLKDQQIKDAIYWAGYDLVNIIRL